MIPSGKVKNSSAWCASFRSNTACSNRLQQSRCYTPFRRPFLSPDEPNQGSFDARVSTTRKDGTPLAFMEQDRQSSGRVVCTSTSSTHRQAPRSAAPISLSPQARICEQRPWNRGKAVRLYEGARQACPHAVMQERLAIRYSLCDTHRAMIMRKLSVTNVAQLLLAALQSGVLELR